MSNLIEPRFSENAIGLLEQRYLRKNEEGNIIETPQEMLWRVADTVAQAEKTYAEDDKVFEERRLEFYERMARLEFIPNSPTLMNAGIGGVLSACFVLPIEDSMTSIFETVKNMSLVQKHGGGTGFSFSRLRPQGDLVGGTGGVASGPLSFMSVLDAATDTVKQGGRRRGANMGVMRVDHPNIVEFITCKGEVNETNRLLIKRYVNDLREEGVQENIIEEKARKFEEALIDGIRNENMEAFGGQFTNFNLSVGITDEFMQAVKNKESFDLLNPRTGEIEKTVDAEWLFHLIVDYSHSKGEPGVIFLDAMNRDNTLREIAEIEATNPCGEQPLLPYESCNLGHINLSTCLYRENGEWKLDYSKIEEIARMGIIFLDNVIDVNDYPIPEIEEASKRSRKVGLGVMGWAEVLIKLGIPYDSQKALDLADKLGELIYTTAVRTSMKLAEERGTFPAYEKSDWSKEAMWTEKGVKVRNACFLTIAPTGNTSIIAGTSASIEPLFSTEFFHTDAEGNQRKFTYEYVKEADDKVVRVARDISPEWHVRMQAAWQEWVDSSISKTVNMPNSATERDVAEILLLSWQLGCKGITIYRDGSRSFQVLTDKENESEEKNTRPNRYRNRPNLVSGMTEKFKTAIGKSYITVNHEDDEPIEVMVVLNPPKKDEITDQTAVALAQEITALGNALARTLSTALKYKVPADELNEQLKEVIGGQPFFHKGQDGEKPKLIKSIPDAIAFTLSRMVESEVKVKIREETNNSKEVCPDCGEEPVKEAGCTTCYSCGWSKCG